MHKFISSSLIFVAGCGLGWYMHAHLGVDPIPSAAPVIVTPSKAVSVEGSAAGAASAVSVHVEKIAFLLQRNEFEAAVERYESFQDQTDDAVVAEARVQILSYARRLIAGGRFGSAEQLLKRFLLAAYRDVEANILLASAYRGQDDFRAAIDQLYEVRGYAYRPAMLQRISARIRAMVAELAQSLKRNNDQNSLLALYQHLTQLEPDYASWFMGLASAQLALNDNDAARRSLLLVSQDPDVGAQAQAMLAQLNLVTRQDTESQDSVTEVADIPLRRRGNHFIVDARPAYGQSIELLIDTGASLTIFSPEVFEQRGIHYQDSGKTFVFNTANGQVRAPVYILDSLLVGDWQVSQLEVGILDLGAQSDIDGLLGMNFLSHFQFFIDQNEALLRLSASGESVSVSR